ncbi:N-acetylglucosaminyltransferase complex, subunit PIG-P, required for phosphatidylinositol biosynthesis [Phaffia rhodozyma]|uniref:N-acetylglucosaminyltransferase complex, subunit PIG-P, required for phosphatidylinositol biosynthesis n=1 Tax=Phaffia rhodozyma TaxID=264483 RepID=A0A0F7SFQ9_PHARH|nr:N-acetylglucosaminyltransferase complex, subunit PIG-P, required for phosphatidylinositol biosynthesis [Phaffia rhodozyma]
MTVQTPSSPTAFTNLPISPWPPRPRQSTGEDGRQASHPNETEVVGFVAAIGTTVAAVVYLLWAFLPSSVLERYGISWYPNREWAILVPAYSMVLIWATYIGYASLMLFNTPPISSSSYVSDQKGMKIPSHTTAYSAYPDHDHVMDESANLTMYDLVADDAVPEAWDVPLEIVSQVRFGSRPAFLSQPPSRSGTERKILNP